MGKGLAARARGMGVYARKGVFWGVSLVSKGWLGSVSGMDVIGSETLLEHLFSTSRQPIITVSNHLSTVDDPLMWAGMLSMQQITALLDRDRMRHVGAAKELVFSNPLYAWFFGHGQSIPLVRGAGIFQPGMAACLAVLNARGWLHFFPEGRVIPPAQRAGCEIARLKWGVARLIMESAQSPMVIPVMLQGFDRLKPYDAALPRPFEPVRVAVGAPLAGADVLAETARHGQHDHRRSAIMRIIQGHMEATLRLF